MLLRALFLRPVRRRPLRFLVTILGVAAGVAAVVATLASSRAAVAALEGGVVELAGRARLEVRASGGIAESVLGELRPIAGDALLVPVVDEVALSPATRAPVRILGIDALVDGGARELAPGLVPGSSTSGSRERFLEFVRGEGAWIGSAVARELDVAVGDEFVLDVRARPVSLRVLGVIEAARGEITSRLVVMDVARAQEVAGRPGRLDRIEIVPRAGVSIAELRPRIEALVPTGAVVAEPAQRGIEARGLVRSLEFNLTALSAISLLVGAVLVATTLATSVVQRAHTIALLRALGASAGQVRRAILFEASVIGLAGGILGTAAGFVGARALLPQMRASVSTLVPAGSASGIRFEWDQAWIGVGLGLVAAWIAAWLPILESARTPPIQALRGEARTALAPRARRIAIGVAVFFALLGMELIQLPAWHGLPIAALAGSLCCLGTLFAALGPIVDGLGSLASRTSALPTPLRLACAALAAGRRRAAWAAGAVGVAVTLSISIATMVHSFRETIVEWTGRSLRADFTIRALTASDGLPVGRLDPAVVDAAAAVVGRDALDPYYATEATRGGETFTFTGADLGLRARRGGPPLTDGGDPAPAFLRAHELGEVLVSESFARRFGVEPGDRVRVEVAGSPYERVIAGVFRSYGDSRGTMTVGLDDYRAYFPTDAPLHVSVYLPDDADRARVHAELSSALAARFQLDVLSNAEVRARVLSVFDRTFAITTALQAVASIVAVVAVLSVLIALVAERRADMALLFAIGASRAQLGGTVVGQAALLGLLGAAAGACAGLAVGLVLVVVVNVQSFGWTLEFRAPWLVLFTTIAGVVAACAAAGILPARATDPRRLASALREE
jgi:putative ABC transport system permease protein